MLYMKGANTLFKEGLCSYVCWAIAKSRGMKLEKRELK